MGADETDKYLELLQRYGKFFADIYLHPVIFFVLVTIIISVYVIRYAIFVNEYKKEASEKGVLKEFRLYVAAHMSIQLLTCFFVSYFVIKFANALIDSYIINWILAPSLGLLLGIILDFKVLVPLENKSGFFTNPLLKNKKDDENDKKEISESSKSINNITINVGSKTTTTTEKEAKLEPMDNGIEIIESNDDIIRTLINVQEEQGRQLQVLMGVIDAMRENIVTNMRFELHDSMMECIIRGYVTTEEYDRISEKMKNYLALKGNHGLTDLYEKKFIVLPIK